MRLPLSRSLVPLLLLFLSLSPSVGASMSDEYFDCGVQIVNNTRFSYPLFVSPDGIVFSKVSKYSLSVDGKEYSDSVPLQKSLPFSVLTLVASYKLNSSGMDLSACKNDDQIRRAVHQTTHKMLCEKFGASEDLLVLSNRQEGDDRRTMTFSFGIEDTGHFPASVKVYDKETSVYSSGVFYGAPVQIFYRLENKI